MTFKVDSFTRVPPGLCASRDIGGEPFARIDDFFPAVPKFVAHWRRRIREGGVGNFRDVFEQKLLVAADGGAPFSLDPQGATMLARQWATFERLFACCGVALFDGLEPAAPLVAEVETRFDYVCRIEAGPELRVDRTLLTTAEKKASELFQALAGRAVPRQLSQVPAFLVQEIGSELKDKLRTETFRTPLLPLVKRAREVMERTVVANHELYSELIDDIIQRRMFDHENTIPDIATSHLVGWVPGLTRAELRERIRQDFSDFEFHPSLARVPFVEKRLVPAPVRAIPPPPAPPPAPDPPLPADPPVQRGNAIYRPEPWGEDLREILSYLSSPLKFYRWRIEGEVDASGDAARVLAGAVPELRPEWRGGVPEAVPVDPAQFWRPRDPVHKFESLRYALYDPPYFGAGPEQIARLEPRLFRILFGEAVEADFSVHRFETKDNAWFINDWWDFCWVVLNPNARQAIAIYGTSTD